MKSKLRGETYKHPCNLMLAHLACRISCAAAELLKFSRRATRPLTSPVVSSVWTLSPPFPSWSLRAPLSILRRSFLSPHPTWAPPLGDPQYPPCCLSHGCSCGSAPTCPSLSFPARRRATKAVLCTLYSQDPAPAHPWKASGKPMLDDLCQATWGKGRPHAVRDADTQSSH